MVAREDRKASTVQTIAVNILEDQVVIVFCQEIIILVKLLSECNMLGHKIATFLWQKLELQNKCDIGLFQCFW